MANNGVIQNGGTMNVGQMAVGSGASVHNDGAEDQRRVVQQLDVLLREVRAARLPPARRDQLAQVVDDLKEEAKSPVPDKSKFESGLAFVERAASSVSTVASAVGAVKALVGALLL